MDTAEEIARRAVLQNRISYVADGLLMGLDPPFRDVGDNERFALLAEALRDLKSDLRFGEPLQAALVALAAEVQLWLEAIERDRSQ